MPKPSSERDRIFLEFFKKKLLILKEGKICYPSGKPLKIYPYIGDGKYNYISYRQKFITEHRAIWLAEYGLIPDRMVINHKDFNTRNNCLENLEIVSAYENHTYSRKAGRFDHVSERNKLNRGEAKGNSRFTQEQAEEIRNLFRLGTRVSELARKYGVCRQTISSLVHNKRYVPL